ncbi:MAG: hypothetical protein JNK75_00265 [Betaproteobacteria bacterium]|nr:hypothetical protein [Betaproteobacteria bacterium]
MRSTHRFAAAGALAAAALQPCASFALLPPANVECCQRKDYTSAQCERFKLDEAACVKANADWNETYKRWHAVMNPKPPAAAAEPAKAAPAKPETAPAKSDSLATDLAIDRVEARLYYQHSGTFSAPIAPGARFWNVIIGEGGAKEPSSTLRVDVVLKGKPGEINVDAKLEVEFVNAETGKRISSQSVMTGVLSDAGFYRSLFVLNPAGCIPLKITARLTGTQGDSSKTTRTIEVPFRCGE